MTRMTVQSEGERWSETLSVAKKAGAPVDVALLRRGYRETSTLTRIMQLASDWLGRAPDDQRVLTASDREIGHHIWALAKFHEDQCG